MQSLREQVAQLREAELLVGQKLDETAVHRRRLEGDLEETRQQLASAKGELFEAKAELESARKRGRTSRRPSRSSWTASKCSRYSDTLPQQ